jgi:hypothetical protein
MTFGGTGTYAKVVILGLEENTIDHKLEQS